MFWFKRKNKKMTQEQLEPIREDLRTVPKFQWIKTENMGKVVHFKDVSEVNGMILVEFDDGSRVNMDMIGEVVLKVYNDSEILEMTPEEQYTPNTPTVNIKKAQQQYKDSPIQTLLRKQKPNMMNMEISIELNLPSHELYKVLSTSFDNADEEIVEFIVADLDVPLIKDAVRNAIKAYYQQGE